MNAMQGMLPGSPGDVEGGWLPRPSVRCSYPPRDVDWGPGRYTDGMVLASVGVAFNVSIRFPSLCRSHLYKNVGIATSSYPFPPSTMALSMKTSQALSMARAQRVRPAVVPRRFVAQVRHWIGYVIF